MRRADARAAIAALKRRADYEFFFSKIDSPEWLPHLKEAGFLCQPPSAIHEGGAVSFPFWPEMAYLERIAARASAQVTRILRQLPTTDNARIHADILEIALLLPARNAASLVLRELRWLKAQPYFYLIFPDTIEKLIRHLCNGGHSAVALRLLGAVLSVAPDSEPEKRAFHPQPRLKLDSYDFARVLAHAVPVVAETRGLAVVGLLVRLLRRAVRYSRMGRERGADDYSYFWADSLSGNAERAGETREALACVLTSTATAIAVRSEDTCRAVLERLAMGRTLVFRRIEMSVVARTPAAPSTMVHALLLSKSNFDDGRCRTEYFQLLRSWFGRVASPDRLQILLWIDAGPDTRPWRRVDAGDEPRVDEETIGRWVAQWKRDRLAVIRDSLSAARKAELAALIEEFGPEETDQRPYRVSVGWGSTSPLKLESARTLSISDLATFVSQWRPSEGSGRADEEGLASVVAEVTSERASEISKGIHHFADCPSGVTARILQSLSSALKGEAELEWVTVIGFCMERLERRRELPNDEGERWLAKVIADLVDAALLQKHVPIPTEHRESVWALIESLCDDPDPSPEAASALGEPYTHAINSVRGRAIETVIHFARWCHDDAVEPIVPPAAFTRSAPHAGRRLARHLDQRFEQSNAVRAVFGAQLAYLVWLDREWTAARINELLPSDWESASTLQRATLWAYIRWAAAGTFPFELVRRGLSVAVKDLQDETQGFDLERGAERLSEHLMVWCWRGDISPESEDRLIAGFFERASSKARSHAFNYIGRSLRNSVEAPPREVVERIQRLWDWRWDHIRKSTDLDDVIGELEAFGWIFGSEYVDGDWAVERLLAAVGLAPSVGVEFPAIERLESLAAIRPRDVMDVLSRALPDGTEHPAYLIRRDEVAAIAARVRASGDAQALRALEELVDRLLAMGFFDAARLLTVTDPDPASHPDSTTT